jgi:DNA-binding GntR family transcriptional regulator
MTLATKAGATQGAGNVSAGNVSGGQRLRAGSLGTAGRRASGLWRSSRTEGSAEAVYLDLKSQILSLVFEPGKALSETDLALRYGVSRTPIREALIRLSDEGLVEIHPKSGTNVSRIPLALLPEAILVRRALEEVTARHAALNATRSGLLGLEARLAHQQELAESGDRMRFHLADEAFHAEIAAMAGYPGIWTLVERAKMHIDRYRRLTLPQEGRMELVIREHTRVLEAIAARDPDAAAGAMATHVEGLKVSIAETRQMNPDFFQEDIREHPLPAA